MKLSITLFILLFSLSIFARDHREPGRDRDNHREDRRDDRRDDRREGSELHIFDISNTLLVSSLTIDNKTEALQVINDSQDYIQSGNLSVLLDQKVTEVQKSNEELSLEDALDLVVTYAMAKL